MAEAKPLTITEFARMGGKALAKKLTKKERSESARRAAQARWEKQRAELKQLNQGAKKLLTQAQKAEEKAAKRAPR